jgi:hypothetical protein
MEKIVYVLASLMFLAACNAQGLNSAQSVISETDKAPNVTSKIDEKEKYKCETKGGYYSKVLGCFEQ